MFILDEPYVSDFLKQTLLKQDAPVLDNAMARTALPGHHAKLCPPEKFIRLFQENADSRLYTNSENALGWVADNLEFSSLPAKIELFKDKVRFRELLRGMYPDYTFLEVPFERLDAVNPAALPKPFVIKPAVGFLSLGVHKVNSDQGWFETVGAIKAEVETIKALYPQQVLDTNRFIIEACIHGAEFAMDAYYDSHGRPVILNILTHLFASEKDVSDRVYITSGRIIETWRERFTAFLSALGERAGLTNFPVHVEVRVDEAGRIAPIEVNPMRFAGWCVADITRHAFGFNPYAYYLEGREPDWESILRSRKGAAWGVVVADTTRGLDPAQIESVDYEAFAARFSNPLELRRIDWRRHPLFAFLFAEGPRRQLGGIRNDPLFRLEGIPPPAVDRHLPPLLHFPLFRVPIESRHYTASLPTGARHGRRQTHEKNLRGRHGHPPGRPAGPPRLPDPGRRGRGVQGIRRPAHRAGHPWAREKSSARWGFSPPGKPRPQWRPPGKPPSLSSVPRASRPSWTRAPSPCKPSSDTWWTASIWPISSWGKSPSRNQKTA